MIIFLPTQSYYIHIFSNFLAKFAIVLAEQAIKVYLHEHATSDEIESIYAIAIVLTLTDLRVC